MFALKHGRVIGIELSELSRVVRMQAEDIDEAKAKAEDLQRDLEITREELRVEKEGRANHESLQHEIRLGMNAQIVALQEQFKAFVQSHAHAESCISLGLIIL